MFNFNKYQALAESFYSDHSEWNTDFNSHVLADIMQQSAQHKKNLAGDLLAKMPQWIDDEMRCKFEYVETIEPDWNQVNNILRVLYNICNNPIDAKFDVMIKLFQHENFRALTIDNVWKEIFLIFGHKVGLGMKMGRAINLLCNEIIEYYEQLMTNAGYRDLYYIERVAIVNREFAKLSDALQTKQVPRVGYLSLNPYDYMRMSWGNSWQSCHRPDGCYSAGAISYALDEVTALIYSESDNALAFRCVVYFAGDTIHFGRVYGTQTMNKGLEQQIVQAITSATGYKVESQFESTRTKLKHTRNTACYIDHDNGHELRTYVFENEVHVYDSNLGIGGAQICLQCGQEHSEDSIICEDCNSMRECAECGHRHSTDDMYYLDGDYYCENCTVSCAHCGSIIRNDDSYDTVDGNVCERCLNNDYCYCERCEEYHRDTDVNWITDDESGYEECVCNSCLE